MSEENTIYDVCWLVGLVKPRTDSFPKYILVTKIRPERIIIDMDYPKVDAMEGMKDRRSWDRV